MKRCKESGMLGVIVPDIPYEEKEEFEDVADEYGISMISMIAPTSKERIKMIAGDAKGFLYVVSSMGVTGIREEFSSDIEDMISAVREVSDIPAAVGFGISNPEKAREMAAKSDGAIVGSAIVKIVGQYGKDCVPYVSKFVKELKDGVRKAN
jgi:tryptophan synthase alpha chain